MSEKCPACRRVVTALHPLKAQGPSVFICEKCRDFYSRFVEPPRWGPSCRICKKPTSGSGSFIGGDELCGECYAYVQLLIDPARLANRKLVDMYQKQLVKMDADAENDERVVYLRKEVKALREVISTKEYEDYRRRYDLDYPEARLEEVAAQEGREARLEEVAAQEGREARP